MIIEVLIFRVLLATQIARENVPRFSIWRLELTWKVLECRDKIHGGLRPQDLLIAEEMVRDGKNLQLAAGVSTPQLEQLISRAFALLEHYRAGKTDEVATELP